MHICRFNHEEIIHEDSFCPLCVEIAKRKIAENDLYNAENRLIEVEEKVEELENKNQELKEELNLFKFKDREPPDRNEDDPREDR